MITGIDEYQSCSIKGFRATVRTTSLTHHDHHHLARKGKEEKIIRTDLQTNCLSRIGMVRKREEGWESIGQRLRRSEARSPVEE